MTPRRLGVVFVHYHTPELAGRAVASVRRELATLAGRGVSGRVVVVDNGSDAAAGQSLAGLGAEVVTPGTNLGYSGGVNAGVGRHPEADVLLLANPDVELLPGALAALLATIERGAAVAGPRFFWDSERRLRLPPTEARDPLSEGLALLAPRSPGWAALARRRWRRSARRHWLAEDDIPSLRLSGALLAVTRQAWQRVGPFDEGFRLYFEETDWLARLDRAGLSARHAAAAEVVHAFAKSAAAEPRAADWYHDSAARYAAKHHGRWRRAVMAALARLGARAGRPDAPRDAAHDEAVERLDLTPFADRGPLWIEVSPHLAGFPAAGEPVAAGAPAWSLPSEVAGGLSGPWWAQVTDATGRELLRRRLEIASRR